jgi:trimeric autotransporter adhesin
LVYGSVSGTSVAINSLDDIGDVSITSATPSQVLSWNGTSWENTNVGLSWNEVNGNSNASFGENVLALANSNSYYNVGIGEESLSLLTEGDHNIAIGFSALNKIVNSDENIAIGKSALTNAVSSYNVAIGSGALFSYTAITAGNVAIGHQSLLSDTSGFRNSAVGFSTLRLNTTGSHHSAFGYDALTKNTTGESNSAFGERALEDNTTGSNNVAIGRLALGNNIEGSSNVAIGYFAGLNETGSNKLYIANSDTSSPLIYGDFSTSYLKINGSLEVTSTLSFQQTTEKVNTSSITSNVMTCDYTTGAIYYQSTNPSANFTANFTNVPTTNNKAITFTIFVTQGATAYLPNAVQIEGSAQTIKWAQSTTPTPTANKIDIFSFTLIRLSDAWTVFGNANTNF